MKSIYTSFSIVLSLVLLSVYAFVYADVPSGSAPPTDPWTPPVIQTGGDGIGGLGGTAGENNNGSDPDNQGADVGVGVGPGADAGADAGY